MTLLPLWTNQFTYFAADDLQTLTDGKGQVTTWNYDIYGRTTNKVDAASAEVFRFQYDPDNRLTNRWSKQKGNTVYSFDPVGNVTSITYPVSHSITLQYDLLNRLTNMVDGVGTTLFTYTSGNQLQSEVGPWVDNTIIYTYNNHLRASLNLLQPNSSAWTETYSYDAARRLTNVTSIAGGFGYTYDALRHAQVANLALPNGAFITNTFDSVARLLTTTLKNSSSSIINAQQYAYNFASQRTWATNTAGDYRGYTYDLIGQLRTAYGTDPTAGTNRWQEQIGYLYDAAGNLAWRTNNALVQSFSLNNLNELTTSTNNGTLTLAGTTTGPATNVTAWGTGLSSGQATIYGDSTWARPAAALPNGSGTYNASAKDTLGRTDTNTVTTYLPTTATYLYDLNGSLTNDGVRSFTYDDENQLISVVVSNGVATSTRTDFTYDGKMRRRIRVECTWGGSSWLTNQIVQYVYDGNLVIQERGGNNVPTETYTRGRDLSGRFQGAGGVGGLLARTDAGMLIGGSASAHAYYHADGNGNVTALINSYQVLVAKYLYDGFGNILSKSGSLADANLYRFSSKEYHLNSGLICYSYRFYDPSLQRWLSIDPLGERGFELMRRANPWERAARGGIPAEISQGPNLYADVQNDPLNSIDPYGLWSFYKWLYTGDGNASDDVYDEALDDAAGYVNCYLDCLKKDNKCVLAWAGSLGAAGIAYGATPRPIANLISPRAALGGSFWKSGIRAIGLRLWDMFGTRSAGSLFLDEAAAFKNAGALGRAGRIGVAGAAIAETGFAIHCAIKCSQQEP